MDKLSQLFMLCKSGVFIEYNEHKLFNDSVEEFLIGQQEREYIDSDVWNIMIELDTIISIEFYPDTLGNPCSVYHYDLYKALDKCLEIAVNLTPNTFKFPSKIAI